MALLGTENPHSLGDIINHISVAQTPELLSARLIEAAEASGFPLTTYHLIRAPGHETPTATHISTYPVEWIEQYVRQRHFERDPVVQAAIRSTSPILWEQEADRRQLEPEARHLMDEAATLGIANGVTIPVRGPSDFALFSLCPADHSGQLVAHVLPQLLLLGISVHERARELLPRVPMPGSRGVRLSPREKQVLQWLAVGKTYWETSCILSLSEATIRTYVQTAMVKLGCQERTHAIVRAIRLGLIEPPY
jgi:DNA-binding CsgD family transcriptional regulator